jgi:hypothetical protein
MRYSLFFRYIVCLIIALFALHVAAPYFAHTQQNNSLKQIASMLADGEKALICSADGFKWLTKEELQRMPAEEHDKTAYKCGLCYLAAQGCTTIATSDLDALQSNLPKPSNSIIAAHNPIIQSPYSGSYSTRAPPSLIG